MMRFFALMLAALIGAPVHAQEAASVEPGAPEVAQEAPNIAPVPAVLNGRVVDVRVTGLRRVEEAALMAAVGMRSGELLAGWKVRRDLVAIYETGFVDDVQVDVSPAPDADPDAQYPAVVVTFSIDEKPAIRDVTISGNKKLDEDALREVIDIGAFAVLNQAEINDNIARMRDKYLEKGFYLVEIEPLLHEVGEDVVELEFSVTENKKVRVQRIDIVGNTAVPDKKIRRFLQTKQAGIVPWLTNSGVFNEGMLEADTQIVRQVMLEEGYVDVKVEPPTTYLSPDKRFIYVTMHVTEGPRYTLGRISIDGQFLPEEGLTKESVRRIIEGESAKNMRLRYDQAVKKAERRTGEQDAKPAEGWDAPKKGWFSFKPNPPMITGDTFKLTTMQTVMAQVSDMYGDEGYAFTNVVPQTVPHPEDAIVDVRFDISAGDKMWIGQIDITGNDPTFDKVVRREIPLNEGELYSTSKINEARARLNRLGFFEEVNISTPQGRDEKTLDMKVDVTERPTGSFSVGAGFSNLENFVFTANVSKNNFLGLGYIMSAAANVSGKRQQGNFQIFDPYFLDSRWTLRLDAYSISRQFIEDVRA